MKKKYLNISDSPRCHDEIEEAIRSELGIEDNNDDNIFGIIDKYINSVVLVRCYLTVFEHRKQNLVYDYEFEICYPYNLNIDDFKSEINSYVDNLSERIEKVYTQICSGNKGCIILED